VRSYSMNTCVGTGSFVMYDGFRVFDKVTQITRPSAIYVLNRFDAGKRTRGSNPSREGRFDQLLLEKTPHIRASVAFQVVSQKLERSGSRIRQARHKSHRHFIGRLIAKPKPFAPLELFRDQALDALDMKVAKEQVRRAIVPR